MTELPYSVALDTSSTVEMLYLFLLQSTTEVTSWSHHGSCSRSFLVELFIRIAGVSYGLFMAMRCKLICQRIFGTVGDR